MSQRLLAGSRASKATCTVFFSDLPIWQFVSRCPGHIVVPNRVRCVPATVTHGQGRECGGALIRGKCAVARFTVDLDALRCELFAGGSRRARYTAYCMGVSRTFEPTA